MAQNVPITAGAGTVIAADQVTDISGAATGAAEVQYMKLVDATIGGTNKLIINASGAANVTSQDTNNAGSLIAVGSVTQINAAGISTSNIQVTGVWVGTLVFEGTLDGTNWFSVNAQVPTTGALVTTASGTGNWTADVAALVQFRVRC